MDWNGQKAEAGEFSSVAIALRHGLIRDVKHRCLAFVCARALRGSSPFGFIKWQSNLHGVRAVTAVPAKSDSRTTKSRQSF